AIGAEPDEAGTNALERARRAGGRLIPSGGLRSAQQRLGHGEVAVLRDAPVRLDDENAPGETAELLAYVSVEVGVRIRLQRRCEIDRDEAQRALRRSRRHGAIAAPGEPKKQGGLGEQKARQAQQRTDGHPAVQASIPDRLSHRRTYSRCPTPSARRPGCPDLVRSSATAA